jgi:hypothetical protein
MVGYDEKAADGLALIAHLQIIFLPYFSSSLFLSISYLLSPRDTRAFDRKK